MVSGHRVPWLVGGDGVPRRLWMGRASSTAPELNPVGVFESSNEMQGRV